MTERRRVPVSRQTGEPMVPDPPVAEEPETCECPYLEAEEWDRVESDWSDITFVQAHVKAVMGVPMSFPALRDGLRVRAEELDAAIPPDAMLLLGPGRFRRPVLLEVEGADPAAEGVVQPGGIAWSRLVQAPLGSLQRFVDEAKIEAREQYGQDPDDMYIWYLTCRVCSSERNYETLIVAHYRSAPAVSA